jgi:voltage-gated potassium channel Kch
MDVLHAAGARKADLICICVDDPDMSLKIVELLHEEFAQARTYVRAYDRIHALKLMRRDVDYHIRETFESAIAFSRAALEELGVDADAAFKIVDEVRKRDIARLMMQKAEGTMGGADLVIGGRIAPEPLIKPAAKAQGLNEETREILGEQEKETV